MAESKASKLASGWTSKKERHVAADLKVLPANVRNAVLEVEALSHDVAERVRLAEQTWETDPDHELALEPGRHSQTSLAYRFEDVGGEIVEIRKDSFDSPVRLIYRPELTTAR